MIYTCNRTATCKSETFVYVIPHDEKCSDSPQSIQYVIMGFSIHKKSILVLPQQK